MINFKEWLKLDYWFSEYATEFHLFKPILALFLLLIVVALILHFFIRKRTENRLLKKFLIGFPQGLYIFGGVGLVLVFLRYEAIRYLSTRFMFLSLLLVFIIWFSYHVFKFKVMFPKVDCEYKKLEEINKYRPTAKKKKKKN